MQPDTISTQALSTALPIFVTRQIAWIERLQRVELNISRSVLTDAISSGNENIRRLRHRRAGMLVLVAIHHLSVRRRHTLHLQAGT